MSISPVRRWGLYSRKLEFLTSSLKSVFIISSGRGDAQELREESLICRKEEIFPHIFLPCPPIPLSCHHTASHSKPGPVTEAATPPTLGRPGLRAWLLRSVPPIASPCTAPHHPCLWCTLLLVQGCSRAQACQHP